MSDINTRRLLLAGAGVATLGAWPLAWSAKLPSLGRPLQLGVLPITSTRVLLGNYAAVTAYLERTLEQPVELVTAPDFRTFQHTTLEGRYDLVVTAAHLGRMAQADAAWVPLVRYAAVHQTLLLHAHDRPLRQIEELRGQRLACPDALTLATTEVVDWLQARGLRAGADYAHLETPTPPSAAHALINGQAVLAVSTHQGMKNTPEPLRDQLAVFATLPELPSLLWLAHQRLAPQQGLLKSILLGLNGKDAGLTAFFEATGYQGVRDIRANDIAVADRYLPRLRQALKAAR